MADSPGSVDDAVLESSISFGHESSFSKALDHHKSPIPEQIFSITEVSPAWAFSTEKTKVFILLIPALLLFWYFVMIESLSCLSYMLQMPLTSLG